VESRVRPGRRRTSLLLFCALVSSAAALWAQGNGDIRLVVKDPTGAAAKASGTLLNLDTKDRRTFDTDALGVFEFSNLPYNRYQISVSKSGFATQTVRVDVRSEKPISQTVTLSLSSQTSSLSIVSVAPLPGTNLLKDDVPMNIQTATAKDIENSGAIDLSDFMNRRLNGVNVNNNQGNPFQPDLNYRGYTASPLLGTPEGMSVFVDGVRQNQPFGDVVAWDLIPKVAIEDMALVPGSDPVFGLNTLGAAVTVRTKDGRSAPGTSISVDGGAFGRREGTFEHGGSNSKGLNWYLAGNWFREEGWRQYSPSQVRQVFGKLGYAKSKTSISLGFSYADNNLTGNGSTDTRFLAKNYKAVNTIPDVTWNRSPAFTLNVAHNLTSNLTLSGAAYFRYVRADTTNGDLNNDSFTESLYNLSAADIAALTKAGYTGFPLSGNSTTEPFPYWRCIAQALEFSEPSEKCTGVFTRTFDKQHSWGTSAQANWLTSHNNLTVGAAWDRSALTYQQAGQFGYLNPDSVSITPINSFEDGSTNSDGVPVDTRVNLHGITNTFGLYATDTIRFGKKLAVTASGRFNHAGIQNIDRLPLADPSVRGSLNGNYTFDRFNPAIGLVYTPVKIVSAYFSYSEANRAPTAIELGCADPTLPCNLPNALVADPPLKQVVAKTLEAGIRSTGESKLKWNAGWFRAENTNDILFVASQQIGFGYFVNYGQTRRQGAEISLSGNYRWFVIGGNYTFLDATFQSTQLLGAGSNSTNNFGPGLDGNITVVPGDRIPQTPRNLLKTYVDFRPTSRISMDLDFDAVGRSFARGNENNLDKPDGVYYLGPGFSPGFGVTNAGIHYQVVKHLQLFAQIDNIFDHRYYTAAQLNATPFDNSGHFIPRPFASDTDAVRNSTFYSPGAPRGAFGGLKFIF
jgi:outer membrane receptor protein involved in Fe transport